MKAMKQAASSGMMRGPRGGMYRIVGGKKVYGASKGGDVHQKEAQAGKHTVHTASGRVLRGLPSHEAGAYHRAMGTESHPQFQAIATHNTSEKQIAKHVASGFQSVKAGNHPADHAQKMTNLGYNASAHRTASSLHLDEAEKHPVGSQEYEAHRALSRAHYKEQTRK